LAALPMQIQKQSTSSNQSSKNFTGSITQIQSPNFGELKHFEFNDDELMNKNIVI
jgi:hypothetical protein